MSTTTITSQIDNENAGNLDAVVDGSLRSRFTDKQLANIDVSISNDGIGGFSMDGLSTVTLPSGTEKIKITLPDFDISWSNTTADVTLINTYPYDYYQRFMSNNSINMNFLVVDGNNATLANVSYSTPNVQVGYGTFPPGSFNVDYPNTGISTTTVNATITPSVSTVTVTRNGSSTAERTLKFKMHIDGTPNNDGTLSGIGGVTL